MEQPLPERFGMPVAVPPRAPVCPGMPRFSEMPKSFSKRKLFAAFGKLAWIYMPAAWILLSKIHKLPGKTGASDVCKRKTPEKLPLQTGISVELCSWFSEMLKSFSKRKLFVGFGKLLATAK